MLLDAANPFATRSSLPFELPDYRLIRTEHYQPAIAAGMVEDIVLERLSGILRTPELALTLSGMTGLDEAAVMRALDGSFWTKATPAEKARMLELLVASVTLYEDKMDIEVRTEGLTCAMEEIENERDQD